MNTIRNTWNQTPPAARWAIGLGGVALAGGALTLALGARLLPGVNAMGYAGLGVGGGAFAVGVALKYRDQVGNPPLLSALVEKMGLRWKGIPIYKENVLWERRKEECLHFKSEFDEWKETGNVKTCSTDMFSIDEVMNHHPRFVRGTFEGGIPYLAVVLKCTNASETDSLNTGARLYLPLEHVAEERPHLWILFEERGEIYQKFLLTKKNGKYHFLFPSPSFNDPQRALSDLAVGRITDSRLGKWQLYS